MLRASSRWPRPYRARCGGHKRAPARPTGRAPADAYIDAAMRAETPAISVAALAKTYRERVAVDGIDFSVARGAIVGLLGGNGAGKTTTIAMIMGLVLPTGGTAKVLGVDMARERHRVLHRINFESPYVEMPKRLTVRQNLQGLRRALQCRATSPARIDELAAELDLDGACSTGPRGELSAGPEDARGAGEGADQPARRAAARRADRLARSRHRRLGALAPRALPPGASARRSCSPRTTCRRWSGSATTC